MERGYSYDQHQGSSRNGNAVPVLFLYNGNVVPVVFFLYTPIVNCNFPWKSFSYKADSLASILRSYMYMILCVYVYDIMDDTSAM